ESAVRVIEDRGLDDGSAPLVVVELAVAGERAAVGKRAVVVDSGGAAAVAAVVRDEHLVAAPASLDRVGRQENLVRLGAGEPRPVTVVAIGRSLVPRLAAVDRREERVVDEVDAGVVDTAAAVLGQVGIAETGVFRWTRRTRTAEVAVAEPVGAPV